MHDTNVGNLHEWRIKLANKLCVRNMKGARKLSFPAISSFQVQLPSLCIRTRGKATKCSLNALLNPGAKSLDIVATWWRVYLAVFVSQYSDITTSYGSGFNTELFDLQSHKPRSHLNYPLHSFE